MTEDERAGERSVWWEQTYRETETVPWDTGTPQQAIVDLAEDGTIRGHVLDVGCGVGTEALFLAEAGYEVVGIDFARAAVERARARADDRAFETAPQFEVADALALSDADLGTFETAIDCGMFHTLDEPDKVAYADSLGSILEDGGRVVCVEFGADAPEDWGPTPIDRADVERTFGQDWRIETLDSTRFHTRQRPVPGLLAVVEYRP